METGQEGFAVGLPFHVRLLPRPAACPRRGLFLRAHAAKAGEGKLKEPVSSTRAGRRPAETEQRPEEVLRQKERLMESERKRAGPGRGVGVPLSLSLPSRPLPARIGTSDILPFPSVPVACVVSVRCVSLIVSSLVSPLSHALMSGTSSWHIICG